VVLDASSFFPVVQPVVNNMIYEGRIPPMVVVGIDNGGQDAQGSQRGFEYDAVNGTMAEWIETEVLPLVEKNAGVRLTKDPDRRAVFGISSSGVAAWTMAWFRPDLYHQIIAYSPTFVNQQWPHNTALRGGAWEYHSIWPGPANERQTGVGSPLILNSPKKPITMWFDCGDRDLFYYSASMADGMHDWTLANENLARVLAEKDSAAFLIALKDVVQARGGVGRLAGRVGIKRPSLYKVLSQQGNPTLTTLQEILKPLGLRVSIALDEAA